MPWSLSSDSRNIRPLARFSVVSASSARIVTPAGVVTGTSLLSEEVGSEPAETGSQAVHINTGMRGQTCPAAVEARITDAQIVESNMRES